MQIYGAPEGTRGCNRLLRFFKYFVNFFFFFFFHVPCGASNLYFSHSNLFIFSPFPGHQMFIFWPVENCTTWNLRYLMLRDAGWALRHWRSCFFFFLLVSLVVGHGHDNTPTPLWFFFLSWRKKKCWIPPPPSPLSDFFRAAAKFVGSWDILHPPP